MGNLATDDIQVVSMVPTEPSLDGIRHDVIQDGDHYVNAGSSDDVTCDVIQDGAPHVDVSPVGVSGVFPPCTDDFDCVSEYVPLYNINSHTTKDNVFVTSSCVNGSCSCRHYIGGRAAQLLPCRAAHFFLIQIQNSMSLLVVSFGRDWLTVSKLLMRVVPPLIGAQTMTLSSRKTLPLRCLTLSDQRLSLRKYQKLTMSRSASIP